jgi:hypothetical protein
LAIASRIVASAGSPASPGGIDCNRCVASAVTVASSSDAVLPSKAIGRMPRRSSSAAALGVRAVAAIQSVRPRDRSIAAEAE